MRLLPCLLTPWRGVPSASAGTPGRAGPRRTLVLPARCVEALREQKTGQVEMSENLAARSSRAGIDQALGIITGQNRCTADEAFEVLRSLSQNRHVESCDIARR